MPGSTSVSVGSDGGEREGRPLEGSALSQSAPERTTAPSTYAGEPEMVIRVPHPMARKYRRPAESIVNGGACAATRVIFSSKSSLYHYPILGRSALSRHLADNREEIVPRRVV